jgi:hypothetical protein
MGAQARRLSIGAGQVTDRRMATGAPIRRLGARYLRIDLSLRVTLSVGTILPGVESVPRDRQEAGSRGVGFAVVGAK